jgi:hypothetical protein
MPLVQVKVIEGAGVSVRSLSPRLVHDLLTADPATIAPAQGESCRR